MEEAGVLCTEERPPTAAIVVAIAAVPVMGLIAWLTSSPYFLALALPQVLAVFVWRRRLARLEASEEGLRSNGKLIVARAELGEAWLVTEPNATFLYVQKLGRRNVLKFRVPTRAVGEELARQLTPSGGVITAEVYAERRILTFVGATLLTMVVSTVAAAVASDTVSLPLAVVVAGLIPILVFLLTRQTIVTGSDGVELRSRWGRRFIAYREIAQASGDGLIELRSGERISLGRPMAPRSGSAAPAFARALERIQEKAREAIGGDAPEIVEAALTNDGAHAYRVAAPTEDALWNAASAGHARPEVRGQAAKALVEQSPTDAMRARIAELASETASTEARDALLAATLEADDDDHEPPKRRHA